MPKAPKEPKAPKPPMTAPSLPKRFATPYGDLGLQPGADKGEINEAYENKMIRLDPEIDAGFDMEIITIGNARDILLDRSLRAAIDGGIKGGRMDAWDVLEIDKEATEEEIKERYVRQIERWGGGYERYIPIVEQLMAQARDWMIPRLHKKAPGQGIAGVDSAMATPRTKPAG